MTQFIARSGIILPFGWGSSEAEAVGSGVE